MHARDDFKVSPPQPLDTRFKKPTVLRDGPGTVLDRRKRMHDALDRVLDEYCYAKPPVKPRPIVTFLDRHLVQKAEAQKAEAAKAGDLRPVGDGLSRLAAGMRVRSAEKLPKEVGTVRSVERGGAKIDWVHPPDKDFPHGAKNMEFWPESDWNRLERA